MLRNVGYKTRLGQLTAYGYLLEENNTVNKTIDTYGFSFIGSTKAGDTKILYSAQFATQTQDTSTAEFDADYLSLSAGAALGGITAKVGYEVLGSDDGNFGFSTPLATLHKFNGWSDQFLGTPAQGLVDTNASLAGKVLGGAWKAVYHTFEADSASATIDDLGSEINLSYVKKYGEHYTTGIKYAAYSAGDIKVDADKIWLWIGAKF